MKSLILVAGLLLQSIAIAQTVEEKPLEQEPVEQKSAKLSYTYAELRFVDVDFRGGDGIRFNGSYEMDGNWLIVGGLTSLDFNNNVDSTLLELGGGYVWHYTEDFDLVSTLRLVRSEIDNGGINADETGFAFSAGTRGLLAPQFEIRGSVNHINLKDSDTFLELAGDYYFTEQVSAGVSLEFAGDRDTITIGVRWFFN
ncbi:MAG: outer membrane beta-barrel protein [Acidiferrobacterales bacterium]